MAGVDVEAFVEPLGADQPCGPDLDAMGDPDYMNLMARVEGDLPASFFAFDRASIDFKSDMTALARLLDESRDLRPVVTLAKLAALNRDLDALSGWLAVAQGLLATQWDAVHPAATDGQAALRSAVLQTLDDLPTLVLPLQYIPLLHSRRSGAIAFRHQLVASGEVARRDGEAEVDAAAIEQALMDGEIADLLAVRDTLARLSGAVLAIRRTWVEKGGFDDAPALDRLTKLSTRMLAFVEDAVTRRAPQAALSAAPGEAPEPAESSATGVETVSRSGFRVESAATASKALSAVVSYLADCEPSNPALLLVCQAQQLVGRSFVDVMKLIMPDALKEVRIAVGVEQQFVFKLDQLPEITFASVEAAEDGEGEPVVEAHSRADAQALLDQIAAYYRSAEPSNPIPLLCERARGMCALDFASLLREMLPKKK